VAGRQFTFFLGPSDQLGFENALRSSGDIAFLRERPRSTVPEEVETSIIHDFGSEPFGILIARRVDLPDVKFRPISGRPEFSCDPTLAPVIEFSRFPSVIADRFIRSGRLYRVDKYWGDDGRLVSKAPEFIEWGGRLYKLAKQSLTRVEQGCFAGSEALELRRSGIAFEGLDVRMGSVKSVD